MRSLSLILILVASFLGTGVANAEMYKWVDSAGNVIYSDKPVPGAELVKEQPIQTYPAPRLPERLAPSAKPADVFSGYQAIEIAKPSQDETIWDNTGNVSIQVNLTPALQVQLGHKLVVLLDGKQVAAPGVAAQFELSALERGAHSVQAKVLDAQGQELGGSAASTFHLKQISTLNRP
jgi:hypothetical protein